MTEWHYELQSPCLSFNTGTFAYRKIDRQIASTQLYKQNNPARFDSGRVVEERRLPTLPPGGAVPSAMTGLTSLFGMGRGGSPPL